MPHLWHLNLLLVWRNWFWKSDLHNPDGRKMSSRIVCSQINHVFLIINIQHLFVEEMKRNCLLLLLNRPSCLWSPSSVECRNNNSSPFDGLNNCFVRAAKSSVSDVMELLVQYTFLTTFDWMIKMLLSFHQQCQGSSERSCSGEVNMNSGFFRADSLGLIYQML